MINSQKNPMLPLKYIIIIFCVLTVGMLVYFGGISFAADDVWIEVNGIELDPSVPVDMTNKTLQMNLKTSGESYVDTSKYRVNWTVASVIDQTIASVNGYAGNQTIGLVNALSPGTATITVTVEDATQSDLGIIATSTCLVNVIFSIDTTVDDSIFKFINPSKRSLVLYSDSPNVPLTLNFGSENNTQWSSANEEIAMVAQRTGVVAPIGAGKTKITATYTPEGSTTTFTSSIDVYIIPRVNNNQTQADNGIYFKSLSIGLSTGDYIYTDAKFGSNNVETIKNKMIWVIKKDDSNGERVVIADSLSKTSDLIKLTPLNSKSNILTVDAKAGRYYVYFYAPGTYTSETNYSAEYNPTFVELTVYADYADYNETLTVGDAYSIADAFNLTLSDFNTLFNPPVLTVNGGDAANYASYNQTTGVISTIRKGTVNVRITPKNSSRVIELFNTQGGTVTPKSTFDITITVIDSLVLDRTSVTISLGQSLTLFPSYSSSAGTLSWSTSDAKYVTVSSNGIIKGIKVTGAGVDIIVSATLDLGNGIILKATCLVKVDEAIASFTLNPANHTMNVGDQHTFTTTFSGNVSMAPFQWYSTDESILTIAPAADNKSAIVTAKAGGRATIMVVNTANQVNAVSMVTITVPVTSIVFKETQVTDKFYKKGMTLSYTIGPANATGELVWNSSDETIATVENGIVSYKKAGKVSISVYPKYNPALTGDTCFLTIVESATAMTLTPKTVTLEAGTVQQLIPALTPTSSTEYTSVTYTSMNTSIASVDAFGLITAKSAGNTTVFANGEGLNVPVPCEVKVTQKATGITFNPNTITIEVGATYTPTTAIKPVNSTDTLSWFTMNAKVASVKAGVVTGVASGTTYIQVKTSGGADALLTVIVQEKVKGLKLDKDAATIKVGTTLTMNPVFTPVEPYNKGVTWKSSNESVASVKNGVVTGIRGGTTVITCVSTDGGYSATSVITVTEKVTTVTLDQTAYKLSVGKSVRLNAIVTSENATNKKVTWTTSKKSIATVSSTGLVRAKKLGKTTIKAKAKDGSGAYAVCMIQVVRKVSSISISRKSATVLVGDIVKLKARIKPLNATIKTAKWTSSDNAIATVDNKGTVQGLAPGLAKIKASAQDGTNKFSICFVTVREKVDSTSVIATATEIIVPKGSSSNAGLTMSPSNSTDKVKYISDNSSVASVSSKGKIFGKSIGTATIYGNTSSGASGSVDVLVVGMNRMNITLRQYDTETVWVNGITAGLKWYSNNPLVATVINGKIVARQTGTTTVYAVVKGTKINCYVKVIKIN